MPRFMLLLLGLAIPGSVAFAQTDTVPAHYTNAQAQQGNDVFRRQCASCHATTEFKGAFFMKRWSSGTVYQLFDFLRTQMPIDDPGSLRAEDYASVIAYMLKLNGLPSGDVMLPTDTDALRLLVISPSSSQERR